jgi:hypothetical protein
VEVGGVAGFVHGGEHGNDGALLLRGEACTSVRCRASASEVSNKEFVGTGLWSVTSCDISVVAAAFVRFCFFCFG